MTPEHLKKIAAIEGRGSDPVHPNFLASFEEVTGLELPESYKRFLTEYGRVWFGDGHGFHRFHEGEKRDGVTSIGYPTLPLIDAFGFRAVAVGDGEHHTDYFLVLEPGEHYGRFYAYSDDAMDHGLLEEPSEEVLELLEDVDDPNQQLDILDDNFVIYFMYSSIDSFIEAIRYTGNDESLQDL